MPVLSDIISICFICHFSFSYLAFSSKEKMSQLEKVPSKQMGIAKCLQFKTKKHKKSHSV